MDVELLAARLAKLSYQPLTSVWTGRLLYELAMREDVENILELGFAHGTSTAYLAAALEEKGSGCVTTLDREDARDREPNLPALLDDLGLSQWVKPVFAARSYNWELMKILEEQTTGGRTEQCFDFCFLDGAHTWETDGFAFLLIDRLLRADRWLLFDDVGWTLGGSPALRDSVAVRGLPEEERSTPQVQKIIDLLVRPLPDYDVHVLGNHALAYKREPGGVPGPHHLDFERLIESNQALVRELTLGAFRATRAGRIDPST